LATYRIAVLPGDGIGPEVMNEALKVIRAIEETFPNLRFQYEEHSVGATFYKNAGTELPSKTVEACKNADAILFGSAGLPNIRKEDGTEILPQITLRFILDLYAGVRPIKSYDPSIGIFKKERPVNYIILRENTEGLYASRSGGVQVGNWIAVDNMVITRPGVERIVRYAFHLADKHPGAPEDGKRRVTCVDKANVLKSMSFFRMIFNEVASEFPEIETEHVYVDAMTLYMVQRPQHFCVVVTENMFGDIISDLGAATVGGLGVAPSADIGDHYGLFQPVHGSAPDIAGKGIANPIAQILSVKMMMEWLGEKRKDQEVINASRVIEKAVELVLMDKRFHTIDIGGNALTKDVGDAIVKNIQRLKMNSFEMQEV
jgi:3-isopropylmalate dehydrogenase